MRTELIAFAELMEDILFQHNGEKGDSWKKLSTRYLLYKLRRHIEDLTWFITGSAEEIDYSHERLIPTPDLVRKACLDVANYAMMLYWRTEEKKDDYMGPDSRS